MGSCLSQRLLSWLAGEAISPLTQHCILRDAGFPRMLEAGCASRMVLQACKAASAHHMIIFNDRDSVGSNMKCIIDVGSASVSPIVGA